MIWKLFLCLLFFSSCGYRFHDVDLACNAHLLSVPYIQGDFDGYLTESLINSVSKSGFYEYTKDCGEYILDVTIVKVEDSPIGYRYDREGQTAKLTDRLVPIERRKTMFLQVALKDVQSEKILVGPFNVKDSIEYDFVDSDSLSDISFVDNSGVREVVLDFSMGQLDTIEHAQDNASIILYRRLADKVTRSLIYRHKSCDKKE